MEYCSVQATPEDFQRCLKVVKDYMREADYQLENLVFELLTGDIMETSAMMGGDFSDENIKEICQIYIDSHFYQRFRNAHKDKLGSSFLRF